MSVQTVGLPRFNRLDWMKDCARAKMPRRGLRPDGEPAMVAFATSAASTLRDARTTSDQLRAVEAAGREEGVQPPPAYYKRAARFQAQTGKGMTARIREIVMDVCIAKVRSGNVGRSWREDFVPEAAHEVVPLIVPLFGSVLWWAVGAFVKWAIIKCIMFAVEAFLQKLMNSGVPESSIDGDPRRQIAAWASAGGASCEGC